MSNERELIEALFSIDTSDKIGATCVYGSYEIKKIINAGAEANGYKAIIAEDTDVCELVDGRKTERHRMVITFTYERK